tara:strand:+ start:18896 stop:19348 length:453 start_codon:yes stop_codon:yes gene_type:complete
VKKLYFKDLNLDHQKILYKWYNLKSVLKNSLKGKKFPYIEHRKWFLIQLKSKNIIKIIYIDDIPIGVIRLEKKNSFLLLSYMIAPKYRRKGYAYKAIKRMVFNSKYNKLKKIVAIVKKDNIPSIKIFRKLKFVKKNNVKNKKFLKFEHST